MRKIGFQVKQTWLNDDLPTTNVFNSVEYFRQYTIFEHSLDLPNDWENFQ